MRKLIPVLLILTTLSACDNDVHYVKAAPVDAVEQGDLE